MAGFVLPARVLTGWLLLAALVSGLAAAKTATLAIYVPDLEAEGAPRLQGHTWIGGGGTWGVWLKQLNGEERLAYIAGQTGLSTDPYATPPGRNAGFLTFLLVVENRGADRLSFNPMSCWLIAGRKIRSQLPLTMSDLSFVYRVAGLDFPAAYERTRSALFESPRIIEAGQQMSGLLVYRAPTPQIKGFRVDLQLALPDGEVFRFAAPYRRLKKNKPPSEEE